MDWVETSEGIEAKRKNIFIKISIPRGVDAMSFQIQDFPTFLSMWLSNENALGGSSVELVMFFTMYVSITQTPKYLDMVMTRYRFEQNLIWSLVIMKLGRCLIYKVDRDQTTFTPKI